MNNFNIFPDVARADLHNIMKNFQGGLDKWQVQPFEVRMEQVLLPTQRKYEFDLFRGNRTARPSEVLLNRNDTFYATHIGFRLGRRASGDETGLQVDNAPFFTNADPNFFDGAAVGGATEQQSLQAIWGGLMTLKTDTTERIRDLSMTYFNWVPENPYRVGATDGVDIDVPYLSQYGETMERRGLYKLTPTIGFDGQQDNRIVINIPGDSLIGNINGDTDSAGAAGQGNKNIAIAVMFGYLIIQGSDPITKG